ncbi:MAG: tRNA (adenosine(37)-N6)-threonylcarbamoyltransferase complex transferase subunit TsaD [Candidatus Kaelpia aquatica]|nr:tRNA (adenosine(37)-N6)-threonylcarbamoyltransferase complex transferase subunit TsaD [Candidatus Kaelpia aquatica]
MRILGIETSCDETSIAVVKDGNIVESNIIASSVGLHKKYGGIVPEIATRHHVEVILPAFKEALSKSGVGLSKIDALAVTQGPGLIGSLMVGITFAKSIAYGLGLPLIPVDHILAHLYSPYLSQAEIEFPYLGLAISGGHTSLFIVKGFCDFKLIGKTRDDALGESFDKVAKMLGLGFPGGPEVERRAKRAKKRDITFTPPKVKDGYDLSYSGLKTAVLYHLKKQDELKDSDIDEICYGFQEAAFKSLLFKAEQALVDFKLKRIIAGGGVTANNRLRELLENLETDVYLTDKKYSSDNAGMVAGFAYQLYNKNKGIGADLNFEPYSIFGERWT